MERDIISCYDKYQENVTKLMADPENERVRQDVSESFRCLCELIRMLMIMKKERLYGHFLMHIRMKVDYDFRAPAGVTMDTMPFTMKVNPVRMARYSIRQIIFILCHEVEHIVLNHPVESRRINKERDPHNEKVLNIAMDASINDRLIYEIKEQGLKFMEFPGDGITSKFLSELLGFSFQPLREFTYYYDHFPVAGVEKVKAPDHEWTKKKDPEDIEADMRLFVRNVVEGLSEEDRRRLPDHEQELLEKLMAPPKIRWQDILRRYVGTVPDGYRKSKARLNRRQPERFDISGRLRSRTVRLVVAIDTSGSMSRKQLQEIFVEIFSILRHTSHEVTVIECDCAVSKVYTAKGLEDVRLQVGGGGGTSFVPVIDYINKEGRFRDAVLIYFTDGMGDYEIPRPMTYRNLWVISGRGGLSVKEPYGDVVRI